MRGISGGNERTWGGVSLLREATADSASTVVTQRKRCSLGEGSFIWPSGKGGG